MLESKCSSAEMSGERRFELRKCARSIDPIDVGALLEHIEKEWCTTSENGNVEGKGKWFDDNFEKVIQRFAARGVKIN